MSRVVKIIVVLLVVVLAAGAAAWFSLDPDSLKPRLVAAVEHATGRTLTISGPLRLQLFPSPAVTAHGVALGNRPGGSDRPMVIVQTIEAHIAWAPLLSRQLDIDRVTLVQPDILLETDADGIGNWQFTRPPAPPSTVPASADPASNIPAAPSAMRLQTEIDRVEIQDGHLLWRDSRTQHNVALDIAVLTAEAASPASAVKFAGTLVAHDTPIQITATTGPLARLNAADGAPWPLDVTLAAVDGRANLKGAIADPLHGRGYDGTIDAALPALDALNRIFPHANLPKLQDVKFHARLADDGSARPAISAASLQVGAADLDFLRPGLRLATLAATLATPTAPIDIQATGSLNDVPVTLSGQVGPATALAAHQPISLKLAGQLGAATLNLDGTLVDPRAIAGLDAQATLNVPDVAALAPAVTRGPLPALRDLSLAAHVSVVDHSQIALRGLALRLPQGDLSGDLTLGTAGRLKLSGTLASQHLDLDAFATVGLTAASPSPPPPPLAAAPPIAAAPPAAPPRPPVMMMARAEPPMPVVLLRLADADLTLSVKQLIWHHTTVESLASHLILAAGHLTVDPFMVHFGSGDLAATLQADTSQPIPPVALTLQVHELPAAPLMDLAGNPGVLSGILDGHAQLHSSGVSPKALLGALDGRLGLTLVNGQIEAGHAASLLAPLLKSAGAPPGLEAQAARARTDLRCFAVAATVTHGEADVGTLMLDSAALQVSGTGAVNLGAETLDLRLKPLLRLAGTGIAVPVRVSGPWRDPKTTWDGPAEHGKATFSAVIGALTKSTPTDDCAPALAAARDGQAGASPVAAPKVKVPNLGDLLKGLTR